LIIFLGYIYILVGICCLFIPIIFLELGRPKDLIKGGLILLIGAFILIKPNALNNFSFLVIFLNSLLLSLYISEVFSFRWNQLLDKEKKKLQNLSKITKFISNIFEIVNQGLKYLLSFKKLFSGTKEDSKEKKWVRNQKNNQNSLKSKSNPETINFISQEIESEKKLKEDIINNEKI